MAEHITCTQTIKPESCIFISQPPLLQLGNLTYLRLKAELCSLVCESEIKQENYNLKKSVLHLTCIAFVKIVLFSGRKRKRGSQGRERHRWLARTQGK